MDISSITDIDKLKAMAYDTLNVIEQQQQNLRILQERITQVEQEAQQKKSK